MAKEIVINAEKEQTRIAIVEQGDLAELYFENPDNARTLGDIYLGRIRRIMPSIKAAFVDIGQKQDAFLHYSDLAENLDALLEYVDQENPQVQEVHRLLAHQKAEPSRPVGKRRKPRHGKATKNETKAADEKSSEKQHVADAQTRSKRRSAQRRAKHRADNKDGNSDKGRRQSHRGPQRGSPDLLQRNQRILVKIVKEPISNKGSRVSSNISLAGRFLVLVPLADYVAVSKKITSPKERRRLRALAKMLLPEGFGVIVRTVAENKDAKSLDTDLRLLLEKWRKIEKNLGGHPEGPVKVHEDVNMASSIIRDLFSNDYDRILVDQPRMYRNIKNYIQAVAPQMASAVQLHKGKKHIFDSTGLKDDIEEVFESRVDLPSGGYLFIERTEAMHVIDVNSGRSGRGMNQEENSLKVNLESARVLARQVRLRDLGGIIVVDFIDMREERNKRKVFDELKNQFRVDRAVTKILPMSDFGLMQITRQRLRPSITTTFSGPDATTNGTSDKQEGDTVEMTRRSRSRAERQKPSATAPAPDVAPEEMMKTMEAWLVAYKARGKRSAVKLCVHPFVAAYLNRKIPNQTTRWFLKYRVRVRLEKDTAISPVTHCFIDLKSGQDITDLASLQPAQKTKEASPKSQPTQKTQGTKQSQGSAAKSQQRGQRNQRGQSRNQQRNQSKGQNKNQNQNKNQGQSKGTTQSKSTAQSKSTTQSKGQNKNQSQSKNQSQNKSQNKSQKGNQTQKGNQKSNQPKQQKNQSKGRQSNAAKNQAKQQTQGTKQNQGNAAKNQAKQPPQGAEQQSQGSAAKSQQRGQRNQRGQSRNQQRNQSKGQNKNQNQNKNQGQSKGTTQSKSTAQSKSTTQSKGQNKNQSQSKNQSQNKSQKGNQTQKGNQKGNQPKQQKNQNQNKESMPPSVPVSQPQSQPQNQEEQG